MRRSQKNDVCKLLHTSLPKYIWVAQAYIRGHYEEPIFDFIFDSVEMPYDGKPFLTNIYSESFNDCFVKFDIQIQNLFDDNRESTVYKVMSEDARNLDVKNIIDRLENENATIEDSILPQDTTNSLNEEMEPILGR